MSLQSFKVWNGTEWVGASANPCGPFDPAPTIPTTGLAAEYRFDEGLGSTLTDYSPNGLDGTITGATWNDFGLVFTRASNSRVVLPANSFAFNTFTVCMALKQKGTTGATEVLIERVNNFSLFISGIVTFEGVNYVYPSIRHNLLDGSGTKATIQAPIDSSTRFVAFAFDGTKMDTHYGSLNDTYTQARASVPSATGAVTIGNSSGFANPIDAEFGYLTVHEGALSAGDLSSVKDAMSAAILARNGFA